MAGRKLRFDGRVAVVTGAGAGLGRSYALLFAERGASVVVNDLGVSRSGEGSSSRAADAVVDEIKAKGGKAVPDYNSVEHGEKIIQTAVQAFGRVDILVNNAGILRDRSFARISDSDWDLVQQVHLKGSFKTTQAAWPLFRKQGFGRIIMTSSTSGIFGNFGQANYSSAKMALIGLSNTLAIEGRKYNIHSNVIVPMASSRLTQDIMPPDLFEQLKPELIAPVVAWLCHESCEDSGSVIEAAAGWAGRYQWFRNNGVSLRNTLTTIPSIEDVQRNWEGIIDMEGATGPSSSHEVSGSFLQILEDMKAGSAKGGWTKESSGESGIDPSAATAYKPPPLKFQYVPKDAILYALGLGISTKDEDHLRFLFEGDENFSVLPTFGIVPAQDAMVNSNVMLGGWPGLEFDLTRILHGEQYTELFKPLTPSMTLNSHVSVADVLDKGSGAVVIIDVDSFDETGEKVMWNQFSVFVVGSGNFGGKRNSSKAVAPGSTPSGPPHFTATYKTSVDQAALYRLSGDFNPLHISPNFAALGGFNKPILHGLCTYGIAARAVLQHYANNDVTRFRAIKARFAKPVYPGQTLKVDMWKEGQRIHFVARTEEVQQTVLTGGYVDLVDSLKARL